MDSPTRWPTRERTPSRWFDTGAFSIAPQFTLGNSSRNPVRGPAYRNVDLAIARRTRLSERWSLEARAEVFNLLNTPAFGSITSAGDPRVVQLALKAHF